MSESREDYREVANDTLAVGGVLSTGRSQTDDRMHEAAQTHMAGPLINQLSHDALEGGHKMAAGKGGNSSDGQSPLSVSSANDLSKHDGIAPDNLSQANNLVFNQNVTKGVLGYSAAAAAVGTKLDLLTPTKASDPGGASLSHPTWTAPGSGPTDCIPLPPALNFCRKLGYGGIRLPNYLNQASVAEIQDAMHGWRVFLPSNCHPGLVPFICQLLAPRCDSPRHQPPCRGYCEALRDDCWTELADKALQLPCHLLPDEEEGYGCLSLTVSRVALNNNLHLHSAFNIEMSQGDLQDHIQAQFDTEPHKDQATKSLAKEFLKQQCLTEEYVLLVD
ncbi:uncharacterized protein [Heterodontus francisci]|uniref:uncharacterized protein n=1 Tax=Heterodontus francisci TaxID=7792 RepID=UPI00355BB47A